MIKMEEILKNLKPVLESAKENAQELLVRHLLELGETTESNKRTADRLRMEIDELEKLIEKLEN